MRRALAVIAALALVAASPASAPRSGTPAHLTAGAASVTIDDFSDGARGWSVTRGTITRRRTIDGEPVLTISGGSISHPLAADSTVSMDLQLSPGAVADVDLGRAGRLHLQADRGRLLAAESTRVHRSAAPHGWYRLEAATAGAGAALDGQAVTTEAANSGRFAVDVSRGSASVRAFIAAPASDPKGLLLQRLAWLHTRTPAGKQPIGMGLDKRLRFSRSWTRGFWPGSLWQAFDLTHSSMFERWATQATRENFGAEHADTHDLGFMYERSSATAYDQLCTHSAASADCKAFRRSAITAADSLLKLAATNSAVGTIPTSSHVRCTGCTSDDESDTIVDSVMNLPLLYWASRVTGDSRYRDVAARHAHVVAADMVRADGSTWSSMVNRRSDGAFVRFDTHQGYRDDSTWARGQAWAIYGFSQGAVALNDTGLLDTAERTTRYVMNRLPTPAVPLYDYDAPASAPHDVSAGVITAAGMLQLADACEALAAACDPAPAGARSYAHRLLTASLAALGKRPPLGFLGHQVYGLGGKSHWDDDAELIFGLDFALEGLA
jgi:unsaturated chondroitin disaccharide hydrolase